MEDDYKHMNKIYSKITDVKIELNSLMGQAQHPASGGVVLFCGIVRNVNHGKDVDYLEYEAHPVLAESIMTDILNEAVEKWNLNFAVAVHRTGKLAIGETAVVIITSTGHRKEAYVANRFVIDKLKADVPIWKKEVFVDGSHEWGNNCDCADHIIPE